MKFRLPSLCKKSLVIFVMLGGFAASACSFALESNGSGNTNLSVWNQEVHNQGQSDYEPSLESVVRPLRWVKNDNRKFRSKSEVMSEVKDRYKAKVLRISLNERRGVYNIRILLPSGKVRSVQLSAYR